MFSQFKPYLDWAKSIHWVDEKETEKSLVKQHMKQLKSGRIVSVQQYNNKKNKKVEQTEKDLYVITAPLNFQFDRNEELVEVEKINNGKDIRVTISGIRTGEINIPRTVVSDVTMTVSDFNKYILPTLGNKKETKKSLPLVIKI